MFNQLDVLEFKYLGEPINRLVPFDTRVALANSEPLQIEIIHQRSPVRTSHSECLDAGYWGLHHVRHFTEDYDQLLKRDRRIPFYCN